mgnify:FL=1
MNFLPGQILPINSNFWPDDITMAVMALVIKSEGDLLTLCPVHNGPEFASFFDLIIPANKNSLGCDLVVMSENQVCVEKSAIHPKVWSDPNDPYIKKCLLMPEDEKKRIIDDIAYLQQNTTIPAAFKVMRGQRLYENSFEYRWRTHLTVQWESFHLAVLLAATEEKIEEYPAYMNLRKVLETICNNFDSFCQAGSRWIEAFEADMTAGMAPSAANAKHAGDGVSQISGLKKSLENKISEEGLMNDRNARLLKGSVADLLELAFRTSRMR